MKVENFNNFKEVGYASVKERELNENYWFFCFINNYNSFCNTIEGLIKLACACFYCLLTTFKKKIISKKFSKFISWAI